MVLPLTPLHQMTVVSWEFNRNNDTLVKLQGLQPPFVDGL
jgi:hypothetical protein